jgi:type IV pilus assembly protein PilA
MEMVVVVAILAVLALIAIPSTTSRIVRNQIASALPLADIAKSPVAASWAGAQAFPTDNASAGLPPPEKIISNYVQSVTVENGAIHIRFGNRVNGLIRGKTLTLRPAVVDDAPIVPVTWACGQAAAPAGMSVKGENRTDIAIEYLPLDCH